MSIVQAMKEAAMYPDLFDIAYCSKLGNTYLHTGTSYKGSSTKSGNNPKAIKARRKKNKNKKTHRK